MNIETIDGIPIDEAKAKRMIERIVKLEKTNLQTKSASDKDMIDKIKKIIREEESSIC